MSQGVNRTVENEMTLKQTTDVRDLWLAIVDLQNKLGELALANQKHEQFLHKFVHHQQLHEIERVEKLLQLDHEQFMLKEQFGNQTNKLSAHAELYERILKLEEEQLASKELFVNQVSKLSAHAEKTSETCLEMQHGQRLQSQSCPGTMEHTAGEGQDQSMNSARPREETTKEAVLEAQKRSGHACHFGETTWIAPIFAFNTELDSASSLYLWLLAIVNVLIQAFLCAIILIDDEFGRAGWSDIKVSMQRWRGADGHNYAELGPEDMNLVTRVCGLDQSLSIASSQNLLLKEINSYLSIPTFGLESVPFPRGPILCMLCLMMFLLIIINEVRQAILLAISLAVLPHQKTCISENRIISMSYVRLTFSWTFCVLRIVIAMTLMYGGVVWISNTASIADLMLNAAALGFVIDVDEMLFASLMPESVIDLVRNVEPLNLPGVQFSYEAFLFLSFFISVLSVAYTQFVVPNAAVMIDLKRDMCGGILNFVIYHQKETNLTLSRETSIFKQPSWDPEAYLARAVSELEKRQFEAWITNMLNREKTSQQSVHFDSNTQIFETWVKMDAGGIAGVVNMDCTDWDMYPGAGGWFAAVWEANKAELDSSFAEKQFKCSDFLQFCDTTHNIITRLICPVTCGCDDPASGLYWSGQVAGCPKSCTKVANDRLQTSQCTDVNLESSTEKASWSRYWRSWEQIESLKALTWWSSPEVHTFLEHIKTNGCREALGLTGLPYSTLGYKPCLEMEMKATGKSSILGFCLETCCKVANVAQGCPASCMQQDDS